MTSAAVMVTVCAVATRAGAVYVVVLPFVTSVPTAGFSVQTTAVFGGPVTVAVKVWDWAGLRETFAVLIAIENAARPVLCASIPSMAMAANEPNADSRFRIVPRFVRRRIVLPVSLL
jgi:hypothetical protein